MGSLLGTSWLPAAVLAHSGSAPFQEVAVTQRGGQNGAEDITGGAMDSLPR